MRTNIQRWIYSAIFLSQTILVAGGVTSDFSLANNHTFDYIIVGGGLTGTTVAARLAENPNVKILLVEAGRDDRRDPRVNDIYQYGQHFGSDLFWSWPTDRGKGMTGGKTLGGSSSVNGGTYTRGIAAQYDAWSTLQEPSEANAGWNWQELWSYMRRSESFSAPNDEQRSKGAGSVDWYHGHNGPVQVTFPRPDLMYGGPQQKAFIDSITSLTGIQYHEDLNGGEPNCVSLAPLVTKIRFLPKVLGPEGIVASGIEFAPAEGGSKRYMAYAKKEMILAAGAIQTPLLLQHSGIGDSDILRPLGIEVRYNLKGVGMNLQEQSMTVLGAHAKSDYNPGGRGPSNALAFPNIYELFGSKSNAAVAKIQSKLDDWAESQAKLGGGISAKALKTIFKKQSDLIINKKAPVAEFFFDNGYPDDIGLLVWPLLPFSRGSVKVTSKDPFAKPETKVNWFTADFDLDVQIEGSRLARRVLSSKQISALTTHETFPGPEVPDDWQRGSDEAWRAWIKKDGAGFNSVSHPVGTCAMMRRDLGGVVNAHLKVYGTSNLRIVDASVMPTQISAHLSSTLYAIAEKAADMIKADQDKW